MSHVSILQLLTQDIATVLAMSHFQYQSTQICEAIVNTTEGLNRQQHKNCRGLQYPTSNNG